MEDLFYRKILKGLIVCALGLTLMFGNDDVLFTLTDFLIGILLGFVKDAHLLAALKNDLALFAFLSVDKLFEIGKLLLKLCIFLFKSRCLVGKSRNDGAVIQFLLRRKRAFFRKQSLRLQHKIHILH